MSYYSEQVLKLKIKIYPHDYICEQVINAKKFIDTNFARALNIDKIAGAAFFSKFHFIRLFKKNYGRTPKQYLTEVRIDEAKRMLRSNIPIAETCFSIGFTSITSFTSLFKKITGYTPSEYQKKHIIKKQS